MTDTILLDLNSTYAGNASEVHQMHMGIYNVHRENYRTWLTKLLRGRHVVMLTSRPDRYRVQTLARILELENWQPDLAIFNAWGLRAPDAKEKMLRDTVFPRFGTPDQREYLAIESNIKTTAMFKRHGIRAVRQQDVAARPSLLDGPLSEVTIASLL